MKNFCGVVALPSVRSLSAPRLRPSRPNVERRRVSGTIAGLPGVHGVVVAPGVRRVYAAATDARELVTIDEQTGALIRRQLSGRDRLRPGRPEGVRLR